MPGINAALRNLGHDVEDAEESTGTALIPAVKPKEKKSRANIDATSDEEDGEK